MELFEHHMVIQIQWTSVTLRSSLVHTPNALPTNASPMDHRWRGRVFCKSEICCNLSFFSNLFRNRHTASDYIKIILNRTVWTARNILVFLSGSQVMGRQRLEPASSLLHTLATNGSKLSLSKNLSLYDYSSRIEIFTVWRSSATIYCIIPSS